MKVACKTLFDCSATGVTGHFRASQIPFKDRAGQLVNDQKTWNRSRNQQRNFETILQIISLRAQPENISTPVQTQGRWCFDFEVESQGVFQLDSNADPNAALYRDCQNVPMIVNLTEEFSIVPKLCVNGTEQNIWFEAINTSLE